MRISFFTYDLDAIVFFGWEESSCRSIFTGVPNSVALLDLSAQFHQEESRIHYASHKCFPYFYSNPTPFYKNESFQFRTRKSCSKSWKRLYSSTTSRSTLLITNGIVLAAPILIKFGMFSKEVFRLSDSTIWLNSALIFSRLEQSINIGFADSFADFAIFRADKWSSLQMGW